MSKKYDKIHDEHAIFQATGKISSLELLTQYVMEAKDSFYQNNKRVSADTIYSVLEDKGKVDSKIARGMHSSARMYYIGFANYAVVNKGMIEGQIGKISTTNLSDCDVKELANNLLKIVNKGKFTKIYGKGRLANASIRDVLYHYLKFYGKR